MKKLSDEAQLTQESYKIPELGFGDAPQLQGGWIPDSIPPIPSIPIATPTPTPKPTIQPTRKPTITPTARPTPQSETAKRAIWQQAVEQAAKKRGVKLPFNQPTATPTPQATKLPLPPTMTPIPRNTPTATPKVIPTNTPQPLPPPPPVQGKPLNLNQIPSSTATLQPDTPFQLYSLSDRLNIPQQQQQSTTNYETNEPETPPIQEATQFDPSKVPSSTATLQPDTPFQLYDVYQALGLERPTEQTPEITDNQLSDEQPQEEDLSPPEDNPDSVVTDPRLNYSAEELQDLIPDDEIPQYLATNEQTQDAATDYEEPTNFGNPLLELTNAWSMPGMQRMRLNDAQRYNEQMNYLGQLASVMNPNGGNYYKNQAQDYLNNLQMKMKNENQEISDRRANIDSIIKNKLMADGRTAKGSSTGTRWQYKTMDVTNPDGTITKQTFAFNPDTNEIQPVGGMNLDNSHATAQSINKVNSIEENIENKYPQTNVNGQSYRFYSPDPKINTELRQGVPKLASIVQSHKEIIDEVSNDVRQLAEALKGRPLTEAEVAANTQFATDIAEMKRNIGIKLQRTVTAMGEMGNVGVIQPGEYMRLAGLVIPGFDEAKNDPSFLASIKDQVFDNVAQYLNAITAFIATARAYDPNAFGGNMGGTSPKALANFANALARDQGGQIEGMKSGLANIEQELKQGLAVKANTLTSVQGIRHANNSPDTIPFMTPQLYQQLLDQIPYTVKGKKPVDYLNPDTNSFVLEELKRRKEEDKKQQEEEEAKKKALEQLLKEPSFYIP